jgi:hypothetical protein
MPQATLPQMLNTPQDLVAAGNVKPQYLWALDQYMQNAQQGNQMGLAEMQRQAQQNTAMDPLLLAHQRLLNSGQDLSNQTAQAGLPGVTATSRKSVAQADLAEYLLPQEKIAGFKKLVAEGDENDRKHAEEQIWTMLRSPDPKQQAIGKQLRGTMEDAIKGSEAAAVKMAEIKQQGANSMAVERLRQEGRLAVAKVAAAAKREAAGAKSAKDWQGLATKWASDLFSEEDPEAKQTIRNNIEYAQSMAERLKPATPQVNPEALPRNPDGSPLMVPARPTMPTPPGMTGAPGIPQGWSVTTKP